MERFSPGEAEVAALAHALNEGMSEDFIPDDYPQGAVTQAFGQVDRDQRGVALAKQAYATEHPYDR